MVAREMAMRMRALIVSAAILTIPGSAAAEPPKAPQVRPATRTAPVIFASADQLPARPVPADAASTPAKRPRVGRVTTCRCGGDPQPQVQEQP
jgi:hypothetical protein